MHTKFIKRGEKTFGPYFYSNYREGDKIKTRYHGKGRAAGDALYKFILLISIIVLLMVIFPIIEKIITALVIQDTQTCSSCSDCNSKMQDNRVLQLSQNITVNGTCITINANNMTIDCQNYFITGNNSGTAISSGFNETKIKNCNIRNFDKGIALVNSRDNSILHSSIDATPSGNRATYFDNVHNSYIFNTTSNGICTDASCAGLYTQSSSNNVINQSYIISYKGFAAYLVSSDNNLFIDSNISNSYIITGLYTVSSSNNVFINCNISGDDSCVDFYGGENNSIINSRLGRIHCEGARGVGALIRGNNNRIINSTFASWLCELFTGVRIESASGNKIINSEIYARDYGARLISSTNNQIENSTLRGIVNDALFESSSNNTLKNVALDYSGNFFSSGSSGNIITDANFKAGSYPTTASFTYSGDIKISSNNSAPDSGNLKNIGKYLNITNYSAASVDLNISYIDFPGEVLLNLYKHNGTSWNLVPGSSVDTVNNRVYANISSFSIFAPMGPGANCGNLTSPNTAYYLIGNISSNGTCFNVQANNVTIECGNYFIIGNGTGIGVNNNGFNSTTIKDCNIRSFQQGIYFISSNYNVIQNTTSESADVSENYGIHFYLADYNKIINSTAKSSGTGLNNNYGLDLENSSHNDFTNMTVSGYWGIEIYRSNNNTIRDSRVYSTQDVAALMIWYYSNNNTVINSYVNGGGNADGIHIAYYSSGNQIINSYAQGNLFIGSELGCGIKTRDSAPGNIIINSTAKSNRRGLCLLTDNNQAINSTAIGNNYNGVYMTSSNNNLTNVIASGPVDFFSSGGSGNIITNMTFNSSSFPTSASFLYSGNIQIDSSNGAANPSLRNISKYLEITNQSLASVSLDMLYSAYDSRFVDESSLRIYRYNGTNWISIPGSTVDTANNIVSAYITSFSIFAPFGNNDTNEPVITIVNPSQSYQFSSGTTQTYINISTDEIAECRYNQTDSNFSFGNGALFTNTNSTQHSFLFAVSGGNSYILYYKCRDSSGNTNANSTSHSFSVASPAPAPPSGGGGGGACSRAWSCTVWSICINRTQTRACNCTCSNIRNCYGDNSTERACCADECVSGRKECISANAFRICADYNLDGCAEWQSASCLAGETCDVATAGCIATVPSPSEAECSADSDCSSGEKCANGKCETKSEIEKPAIPLLTYIGIALGTAVVIVLIIIIRDLILLARKMPGIKVKAGARHLPGKRPEFPEIKSKAAKRRK